MKLFGKKKLSAYTDFNNANYMVLMFRKINGKYVKIDKIKISITQHKFKYKNKEFFKFDPNCILFSDNKFNYYGFDYDSEAQFSITGNELPKGITLNDIDNYVNGSLIKQLVTELEEKKSDLGKLIYIVLGIVIGALIGYLVGSSLNVNPV